MPDIEGIEAGRQIHAIDPSVPSVLFTLLDPWGLESAARNAGICKIVSKSEGWKLVESIEQIVSEFDCSSRQAKSKVNAGQPKSRAAGH